MSSFSDQLHEVKLSISLGTTSRFLTQPSCISKSSPLTALLQFKSLAEATPSLIPLMAADVQDQDEEMTSIEMFGLHDVSFIPQCHNFSGGSQFDYGSLCNLGVWCISIQQLNESVLVPHFDSLLQAVVHGVENPMGSLSTTYEAIQAIMRLGVQLPEKMRGFSHVWAPSIYRRLLSSDKRERDMSERCLLKIRSLMLPPSLNLSKHEDLLNHGSKVQTIRAWGWFIQLLGAYALKNRNLINDMLKIPELTFLDQDPQLQIASQVAWEGLIDALIHPGILPNTRNDATEDECFQQMGASKIQNNEIQANGFSKSLKLIMTPLIGIMSSKCDASVYTSCFNTWCYLLHKLGSAVNCSSVKKLVLQPVCEAVFQNGPDHKSISVWNLCINLIDDLILAKCRDANIEPADPECNHLSATTSINGPLTSGKCPWKQYPIKWLPLINQASKITVSHENRTLTYDASLRVFRSVVKGVQIDFKKASTTYDDILLSLNTILRFMKYLYDENSDGSDKNDFQIISLQLIEIVLEEIKPSVLGSPLYKVPLDLKYIESQSIADTCKSFRDVLSNLYGYGFTGSYLTVLYFCVVAQSDLNTSNAKFFQQAMQKYFKIILSSYEPQDNFVITIDLLYKHKGPSCLRMWTAIAESLKDCICDVENPSLFNWLTGESLVAPQNKLELEQAVGVWKSLYGSLRTSQLECFKANKFPEDLCDTIEEA
ncbi:hypothetical protein G4B88_030865 [Cannabis sativa]|uniref:Telomere-associated protein Rif1 N-terminal domain-containing protein n=1 Tax=Cannabis sativa TaxID=3483 RepID=A0A7J6DIY1_CANSA|nr:hypothetical protein G4B88_030865 [Cannabis sativa]